MVREPPVRDETVILDGLRFHYQDWGNLAAPPLVLLRGYTSHARNWDTLGRRWADRCRILALDLRGHGESDWDGDYHEQRLIEDLGAFVDALAHSTLTTASFSSVGYLPVD